MNKPNLNTNIPMTEHDFEWMRTQWRCQRERMNEIAALANALFMQQEPDTHAYHLASLLADMCINFQHVHQLDRLFGFDPEGESVGMPASVAALFKADNRETLAQE